MKGLIYVCLLIALLSCNDTAKNPTNNNAAIPTTGSDSLYKAVMEGHDVAMARMGDIVRYKTLLQSKADSLKAAANHDTVLLAGFETTVKDLDYAEELMNKWMREFEPDDAGTTEPEMVAFYTKEKEKVDTVKVRMFRSLDKAQELLK